MSRLTFQDITWTVKRGRTADAAAHDALTLRAEPFATLRRHPRCRRIDPRELLTALRRLRAEGWAFYDEKRGWGLVFGRRSNDPQNPPYYSEVTFGPVVVSKQAF